MSNSEEETYSTIFTGLKHPARRKILRMLSEETLTFSRILEELGISSSHLTYHLENLGELISKMEDGRYRLSTFGVAAVNTMRGVEEVPKIRRGRLSSLPLRWQSLIGVLIVGVLLGATFSYTLYLSLNQISTDHEQLITDFEQLSLEYGRIVSWGVSTDKVLVFLREVVQLDLSKYHAILVSNTMEYRSDLGGMTEEILKYSLTSEDSQVDVIFRFRNQTLSRYQLYILEGSPFYTQPQPANTIDLAKQILGRYQTYTGAPYLEELMDLLNPVNKTTEMEETIQNTKLKISVSGDDVDVEWMATSEGIDFSAKNLRFSFDQGSLTMFTDGWYLFSIGSTELNVQAEEATTIALEYAKGFSWTVNGTEISDFVILDQSIKAEMWPHTREEPLALIPFWFVTIPLDGVYPGGIDRLGIGVWGDTGEISGGRAMSG